MMMCSIFGIVSMPSGFEGSGRSPGPSGFPVRVVVVMPPEPLGLVVADLAPSDDDDEQASSAPPSTTAPAPAAIPCRTSRRPIGGIGTAAERSHEVRREGDRAVSP